MTYKFWELEIDGPDKTGKDLLCSYLCELSHYRFSINVRGLISQLVYSKKFNRDFEYDTRDFSKHKILIVLLGEPADLAVRCKTTGEPSYDIENDLNLFKLAAYEVEEKGYIVLKYDTSAATPYAIARDVLRIVEELEEED